MCLLGHLCRLCHLLFQIQLGADGIANRDVGREMEGVRAGEDEAR
jgi:hypothetical protein